MITKEASDRIFKDELDSVLDLSSSLYPEYKGNIVDFAKDKFNVELSTIQIKIAEQVLSQSVTNVPAAHGIGKSFFIAILVYYWVFVVGGQCFTTAPTSSQLYENIWNPINILWEKNKDKFPGGRCLTRELKYTSTARAFGRTAKDYDVNSIQGKHIRNLLLIEDEAGGITPQIDIGIKSCATGESSKIFRVGNPVEPYTAFYYNCLISQLRIPVWEHENIKWAYEIRPKESPYHRLKEDIRKAITYFDENGKIRVLPSTQWPAHYPRYVIDSAVDIRWVEEMRQDYGEGSSEWLGRVEAVFPISVSNGIVSIPKLRECRRYDALERALSDTGDIYLGVDVGGGSDPHCVSLMRHSAFLDYQLIPTHNDGDDLKRLGEFLLEYIPQVDEYNSNTIHIGYDATGEGSGAETAIKDVLVNESYYKRIKFYRIKSGSASSDPTVYANLKAEQLGTFALYVLSGDIDIFIDDEKYRNFEQEIAFITKTYTRRFRAMQVIPKEDYKKKVGKSHDITDSLMNAFAIRNKLVSVRSSTNKNNKEKTLGLLRKSA